MTALRPFILWPRAVLFVVARVPAVIVGGIACLFIENFDDFWRAER
jgi:hypothetical protein